MSGNENVRLTDSAKLPKAARDELTCRIEFRHTLHWNFLDDSV